MRSALWRAQSANDAIGAVMIGVGSRRYYVMGAVLDQPAVKVVAGCHAKPGRLDQARASRRRISSTPMVLLLTGYAEHSDLESLQKADFEIEAKPITRALLLERVAGKLNARDRTAARPSPCWSPIESTRW